MTDADPRAAQLTRRGVLSTTAAAALGLPVLAACSSGGSSSGSSAGSSSSGAATKAPGGGTELAKTTAVPVGGAVSATAAGGKPAIVAQPKKGEFVAMSAICTHMGCTVAPHGSELLCPCHGSTYSLTGQNTGGPAPSPLPSIKVTVKNGAVVES
jgi:cytochrome b6-f complex iron-sulfur subunit